MAINNESLISELNRLQEKIESGTATQEEVMLKESIEEMFGTGNFLNPDNPFTALTLQTPELPEPKLEDFFVREQAPQNNNEEAGSTFNTQNLTGIDADIDINEEARRAKFINDNYVPKEEAVSREDYDTLLETLQSYSNTGNLNNRLDIFGTAIQGGFGKNNALIGAASGIASAAGIARSISSGMGRGNRMKEIRDEYNRKRPLFEGTFQEGGGIPMPEELSSSQLTGSDNPFEEVIANLEGGEKVLQEDGNIQEVKGPRHEEGGVDVTREDIPGEAEVLSDDTEIGSDNSKEINELYGAKTKAKDTYSEALNKIEKILGVKDLEKQQEETITNLQKVERSKGIGSDTKDLNKQELFDQITEIESQLEQLQEQRQSAFQMLYQMQEEGKPEEERDEEIMELTEPQETGEADLEQMLEMLGGEGQTDQEIFRKGGKIKKKLQEGGEINKDKTSIAERLKAALKAISKDEIEYIKNNIGKPLEYIDRSISAEGERLKKLIENPPRNWYELDLILTENTIIGDRGNIDFTYGLGADEAEQEEVRETIINAIEGTEPQEIETKETKEIQARDSDNNFIEDEEGNKINKKVIEDVSDYYLKNTYPTSNYGEVRDNRTIHDAADLGTNGQNIDIPTIEGGTIKKVIRDNVKGAGNYVEIETNTGRVLRFLHLEENSIPGWVKKGVKVNPGDVIGRSGNTDGTEKGGDVHIHIDYDRLQRGVNTRFQNIRDKKNALREDNNYSNPYEIMKGLFKTKAFDHNIWKSSSEFLRENPDVDRDLYYEGINKDLYNIENIDLYNRFIKETEGNPERIFETLTPEERNNLADLGIKTLSDYAGHASTVGENSIPEELQEKMKTASEYTNLFKDNELENIPVFGVPSITEPETTGEREEGTGQSEEGGIEDKTTQPSPEDKGPGTKGEGAEDFEIQREQIDASLLPNPFRAEYPLPPSSPVAPERRSVRMGRMSIADMNVDGHLAEIDRQETEAIENLGSLPPSQRAEAEARIREETNRNRNQVISQANQVNLQNQQNVLNQNLQLSSQEELQNLKFAEDYENKIFKTVDLYENSLRNWYDNIVSRERQAAQDNREYRMRNQLSENYMIGPDGRIIFTGEGYNFADALRQPKEEEN